MAFTPHANDKPVTRAAGHYIDKRWGVSQGTWRSGSYGDHPRGLAIDARTTNKRIGDEIAAWALEQRGIVRWVGWWGRGATPELGWFQPWSDHYDHVHISFLASASNNANFVPAIGAPPGTEVPQNGGGGGLLGWTVQPVVDFIEEYAFRGALILGGMALITVGMTSYLLQTPIAKAAASVATNVIPTGRVLKTARKVTR